MDAVGFSTGWVRGCDRMRALYHIHLYICGDGQRWGLLTTTVLPLTVKSTVLAKWRSPTDWVAALDGLTVQAHCLSKYSHYSPPQPLAQLSLNQRAILRLVDFGKKGMGLGQGIIIGEIVLRVQ